jgi:hypothetical protein
MELTNKKALPLAIVKEISELRAIAREIANENRDIVSYSEGDETIFRFTDNDANSDFFLELFESTFEDNTTRIRHFFKRKPWSETDIKEGSDH